MELAEPRTFVPPAARGPPARNFTPTPGQRSLIQAALSSGMTPRVVAKSLKVPLGLVEAILKNDGG